MTRAQPELTSLVIEPDFTFLATVTVTFNPSLPEIAAQLRALPVSCIKIIIDNASHAPIWDKIQSLSKQFQHVHLIRCDSNLGVAAAVNRAVLCLSTLAKKPDFALLLDQDSIPQPRSIESLLSAFRHLQEKGHKVGCVGPSLMDHHTKLIHGFHFRTRLRWTRLYPSFCSEPIQCSSINGSGTLVPVALFNELGGLDEALFIDHVDTEWSFRVLAHGYQIWGVPKSVFEHSMGEASARFWFFGWRIWPVRSPQRHYYLYRNAILLLKRSYVPRVWKVWAVAKLMLTTGIMLLTGPARCQQLKGMWEGVIRGIFRSV